MLALLAQGLAAPLIAAYLITLVAAVALLAARPGHGAGGRGDTRIRNSSRRPSGKSL